MSDWSAGYTADIEYIFGYYGEMNPARIKMAFANAGLVWPEIGTACELGFGQGLNINMQAATSAVSWYGSDFNPAQVGFANDMAKASGADVHLYEDDFQQFNDREELPDFDFICLHGIWSWINTEFRQQILDFVAKKLKTGGVLYISYNTLPGWQPMAPLRHLMAHYADRTLSPEVSSIVKADNALNFAKEMLEKQPRFSNVNPAADIMFKEVLKQDRVYVSHEYFNRNWDASYFSEIEQALSAIKLNFACSAYYMDHIEGVAFNAEQREYLAGIKDAVLRESVKDFMMNQKFRRDFWVKGARRLSPAQMVAAMKPLRFIATIPPEELEYKVKGSFGEADLNQAVYEPIMTLMLDHKVRTFLEIGTAVADKGIDFVRLREAVMVLCGTGYLQPAQSEEDIKQGRKQALKLNRYLIERARTESDVNFLSSPVVGGGVGVARIQMLFMLAQLEGQKTNDDMVSFVWRILESAGQRMQKEGVALESPEQNIQQLHQSLAEYLTKRLPVLKALQVI